MKEENVELLINIVRTLFSLALWAAGGYYITKHYGWGLFISVCAIAYSYSLDGKFREENEGKKKVRPMMR